jgi:hypothetical protein
VQFSYTITAAPSLLAALETKVTSQGSTNMAAFQTAFKNLLTQSQANYAGSLTVKSFTAVAVTGGPATTPSQVSTAVSTTATTSTEFISPVDFEEARLVDQVSLTNVSRLETVIDGSEIIAQAMSVQDALAAGGNVEVTAASSMGPEVKVSVPASALQQAVSGDKAVLVLVVPDRNSSSKGSTLGGDLAAAKNSQSGVRGLMSVKIFSKGKEVKVSGLTEPISLVLPVPASGDLDCSFWSTDTQSWSTTGVSTGTSSKGQLTCLTTHLTVFAGILSIFSCNQAQVLSDKGMQAIGQGNWASQAPAVVFWLVLIAHLGLVTGAVVLDRRRNHRRKLSDGSFIVVDQDLSSLEKTSQGGFLQETFWWLPCCRNKADLNEQVVTSLVTEDSVDDLKQPKKSRCRSMVSFILAKILATVHEQKTCAEHWMTPADLNFILQKLQDKHAEMLDSVDDDELPAIRFTVRSTDSIDDALEFNTACWSDRRGAELVSDIARSKSVATSTLGERKPLHQMLLLLALSQLPSIVVLYESIFSSSATRALMLCCKVFGGMMVVCLFFQASGGALMTASDPRCELEGPWENFGRTLVITLISQIVAFVPAFIVHQLGKRRFTIVHSIEAQQSRLKRWRCQDIALWLISIAYLIFCFIFVIAFLANVSQEDGGRWLISLCTSLIISNILVPSCFALMGTLLSTIANSTRIHDTLLKTYPKWKMNWKKRVMPGHIRNNPRHQSSPESFAVTSTIEGSEVHNFIEQHEQHAPTTDVPGVVPDQLS